MEAVFRIAVPPKRPRLEADELMIRWNNLPRDSHAMLYMPDVDARLVVAAAAARNGPPVLTQRDDDTLLCRIGDVTYVPVPGPRDLNIPGLISIELPATVTKGQVFTATVHQVSGWPRRIIGSFQITVPVHGAPEILPRETRGLAVLRYIGLTIPTDNRWDKIWQRFLGQVSDRVRDLGGDPNAVHPSPTGEGRPDHPPKPGEEEPGDEKPDTMTGKVSRLLYDCFGRFEGFVLKTRAREHSFKFREHGMPLQPAGHRVGQRGKGKTDRDRVLLAIWISVLPPGKTRGFEPPSPGATEPTTLCRSVR
jgi:hypothetical protein